VTLNQGNVTAYYFPEGTPLRVEAGEILITAASGLKAVGEIAIVDGSIVITAKEGSLQVDNLGALQILPQGQTTVIGPKIKKRGGIIGLKTAIITAGGIAAAAAIAAELELNKAQSAATCTPTPATSSTVSPTPPCP